MKLLRKIAGFVRSVAASAVGKVAVVAGVLGLSTVAAHAQSTPAFDYTAFNTTLTTGITAVGAVATAIAAVMAGVIVWRKIAKYFGKAG